jgi:hypothetical protein
MVMGRYVRCAQGSSSRLGLEKINFATSTFIFNDTTVGTLSSSGDRILKEMPRNSIGVIRGLNQENRLPVSTPQFYITATNANHTKGFFTPSASDAKGGLMWPTAGFSISGNLFILTTRVVEISGAAFGFEIVGSDIIHASNPRDDPWSWKVEQVPLLFTSSKLYWATAALVDPNSEYVYIYGAAMRNQSDTYNTVARIAAKDAISVDAQNWNQRLEILAADRQGSSVWVPFSQQSQGNLSPAAVASPAISETSVFFSTLLKQYVMLRST